MAQNQVSDLSVGAFSTGKRHLRLSKGKPGHVNFTLETPLIPRGLSDQDPCIYPKSQMSPKITPRIPTHPQNLWTRPEHYKGTTLDALLRPNSQGDTSCPRSKWPHKHRYCKVQDKPCLARTLVPVLKVVLVYKVWPENASHTYLGNFDYSIFHFNYWLWNLLPQ